MRYLSTLGKTNPVDFRTALLKGLAPDGGLYMPEEIPAIDPTEILENANDFHDISFQMLQPFIEDEIPPQDLKEIIRSAFNFPVPLTPLKDGITLVELFHGPTFAFKDFAARFMARTMSYFLRDTELTILVATSGDTGSAIGNAYLGLPNMSVRIFYPSGKVSPLQEKQLTTLGDNIRAFEVEGTFDDCQRLVKEAFQDTELNERLKLTSANSINIGRLLPQATYYAYAFGQVMTAHPDTLVAVPSGNFGNLTAGLMAKKMGIPIPRFIAATNANTVVPEYLESGRYTPRPSVHTLANAMDVGNPSNFDRMRFLYNDSVDAMRRDLVGFSVTDHEIRDTIRSTFDRTGTVIDPHTACGVNAVYKYREAIHNHCPVLVMSTAHPAKFMEIVEPVIGRPVALPEGLRACLEKEKIATRIKPSLDELRPYL